MLRYTKKIYLVSQYYVLWNCDSKLKNIADF